MSHFVFFDTETTGLSRDFDQILQFAAILTDNNFRELDRFEIRCRCLPWIVPAPMALKVTGVTPQQLTDPTLPSFFEMMGAIKNKLTAWSPATFVGYNSMRFDEPLLQRAFWQTLHPPYLTVTGGNSRMDLLPIVQAASHLAEGALIFPRTEKGNTGFKLDAVAPLNGFPHTNAHDALADVEATIHIAGLISERVPALWQSSVARSTKQATAGILQQGRPVCVAEYFMGKPVVWWGQRIDNNGARGTNASVLRLETDWREIANADAPAIEKLLASSPKPLRQLGLNKAPVVFTVEEAKLNWNAELDEQAAAVSAFLNASPGICRNILDHYSSIQQPWPEPEYLEQRMLEGFPTRADEQAMLTFQKATWTERAQIMRSFDDNRFSQLAQRIIYVDAPGILEPADRERLETAIIQRLQQDIDEKNLWRTIPEAMRDLENVRATEGGEDFAQMIEVWLGSIRR
ncbi:MAG: exodeoxyribonuclease I [Henriciella sp.]